MRYWGVAAGLILMVLVAVIGVATLDFQANCRDCWLFRHHRHKNGERNPSTSLKTITSAQADFRANDRDGDKVTQFWRADIAGLYALAPGGGPAIRLIELSVAAADDRPVLSIAPYAKPAPKSGYWYRALRHADEAVLDANLRFAAECHPADYPKSGRWTFIVDENNTVFRADLGHGRGIEVYPTDDELRAKWSKLD
ncbi:MAG TPA: DUF2950 family protein [Planctomycetota bacterium]|nr:DUF2950 family protein [Planctomycetota bacterium]